MKDNRPPKEERTLKRGDVREDGRIFSKYAPTSKNGELWQTSSSWDRQNQSQKEWSIANRHRISEKQRSSEDRKSYQKEWYQLNKKRILIKNKKNRLSNEIVRMRSNVRARARHAIKRGMANKCGDTMELMGCSWDELKTHLESQFTGKMSWGNYGLRGWHIDHIKPCAKFDLTLDSEQKKCFHYTNLQPLWAEDNWAKGDKYIKALDIGRALPFNDLR
jgi:hypothetical protein